MYTTPDKIATGILRNIRVFSWNDYVAQFFIFFKKKNLQPRKLKYSICVGWNWNLFHALPGN